MAEHPAADAPMDGSGGGAAAGGGSPAKRGRMETSGTSGTSHGGGTAHGGAGAADASYRTFNGPVDNGVDYGLSAGRTIDRGSHPREMPVRISKRLRAAIKEVVEEEEEELVTYQRQIAQVAHLLKATTNYVGQMRDIIWIDPTAEADKARIARLAETGAVITGFYNGRHYDLSDQEFPDLVGITGTTKGAGAILVQNGEMKPVVATADQLAISQWQSGSGFHFFTGDIMPRAKTEQATIAQFSMKDIKSKPDQGFVDVADTRPVELEFCDIEYGWSQTADYATQQPGENTVTDSLKEPAPSGDFTDPKGAPQFGEVIFGTIPSVSRLRKICADYGLTPEELLMWQLGEQNDRTTTEEIPFGKRWAIPKYNPNDKETFNQFTTDYTKDKIRKYGYMYNRGKLPKLFNITKVDKYKHQPRTTDSSSTASGEKLISQTKTDRLFGTGNYKFRRMPELHWQDILQETGASRQFETNEGRETEMGTSVPVKGNGTVSQRLMETLDSYVPDTTMNDCEIQTLMRSGRLHGATRVGKYHVPLTNGSPQTATLDGTSTTMTHLSSYTVTDRGGANPRVIWGSKFCFEALKFENDVPFMYVRGNAPSYFTSNFYRYWLNYPLVADATRDANPVNPQAQLNTTPSFHPFGQSAGSSSVARAKLVPTGGLRFHCRYKIGVKRSLDT